MNKIASALVTGLLVVGLAPMTVLASSGAPSAGSGTWDDCNTNGTLAFVGPNLIVTVDISENYYGMLEGTYLGTERDVVYADGSATLHGSGTFSGTVAGLTGTGRLSYEGFVPTTGVMPATGPGSGKWVLVGETGGLASVTARGNWGGASQDVPEPCDWGNYGGTYSGQWSRGSAPSGPGAGGEPSTYAEGSRRYPTRISTVSDDPSSAVSATRKRSPFVFNGIASTMRRPTMASTSSWRARSRQVKNRASWRCMIPR